jgi:type I restriction enzyme S subunit
MSSDGLIATHIDLPYLPEGWIWKSLSELVDPNRGICYGIVQPGKHDPIGVPMVNTGDVSDGNVASDIAFKVSTDLHSKFRRSTLRGGELLVTLVGANFGRVAIAPERFKGFNCSRAVGVVPLIEDAKYVMFALRSPLTRHLMDTWANTTAQPTFNLKDLGNLPIPLPPKFEREAIAEAISAFDDRITLLRETNTTLEAIAQALFKSWFVDFDPVHAKLQGRAPEGMDEATAALFPDNFEESELGPVPKGWSVRSLDSIATFLNGLALQKFPPSGLDDLPVIKIAQLRKGDSVGADMASRSIKPEYIVQNGDVLFSWSGSLEVEIWCGGEGALNQHLFKVSSNDFPKWFHFLWARYHLPNFRQIAASKATTMGHIQRAHLTAAKVLAPSEDILHAADMVIAPILERIIGNALQTNSLASVRDTLLPRLISGELRISDAAKHMERTRT